MGAGAPVRPRRSRYRGWRLPGRLVLAVIGLMALPVAADFGNGWVKAVGACRVVRVIDGDTVALACAQAPQARLRLARIDTPELRGACWQERLAAVRASLFLRWQLYRAGRIEVTLSGRRGRYGRALGGLLVDGAPVSKALLDAGLARPYLLGDTPWCDHLTGAAA